jgi:voltage-gated potassium channel
MARLDLRLVRNVLLVALAYAGLLLCLVYVEHGHAEARIHSFGDAVWFSIVTLTTVGYGDFYPVTTAGRLLGLAFLLGSVGLTGLLIGRFVEYITELQEKRKMGHYETDFENHVVIVGWNSFAETVAEQLVAAGRRVAVVTGDRDKVDLIHEKFEDDRIHVLFTDLSNVEGFAPTNVTEARGVFVNLDDDTDTLITIINLRRHFGDRNYIATIDSDDLRDTFLTAGATHVLFRDGIAAKLTASYIFEPSVAEFSTDLLGSAGMQEDYDIQQYYIREGSRYDGAAYGDAMDDLRRRLNCLPIGLYKTGGGSRPSSESRGDAAPSGAAEGGKAGAPLPEGELLKLPPGDTPIAPGDYLLLILDGSKTPAVRDLFGVEEGLH